MKKNILVISLLFICQYLYSQNDSIINYLDKKGRIIKTKEKALKEARFFEVVKKEGDSLWQVRKFSRDGKIMDMRFYQTKDREMPIGQHVKYNRFDSISSIKFYNKKGQKHGKSRAWFDNQNKSAEGLYLNDKREGVWNFYHYNGVLASRIVFKNDSLLKGQSFDEQGKETVFKKKNIFKEPTFKGGKLRFVEKLKKLTNKINYKVKGLIFVNFIVDVDGKITNVKIDEKLPKKLEKHIVKYFESIEGWSPAINLHRKIPYNFNVPLNFGS